MQFSEFQLRLRNRRRVLIEVFANQLAAGHWSMFAT